MRPGYYTTGGARHEITDPRFTPSGDRKELIDGYFAVGGERRRWLSRGGGIMVRGDGSDADSPFFKASLTGTTLSMEQLMSDGLSSEVSVIRAVIPVGRNTFLFTLGASQSNFIYRGVISGSTVNVTQLTGPAFGIFVQAGVVIDGRYLLVDRFGGAKEVVVTDDTYTLTTLSVLGEVSGVSYGCGFTLGDSHYITYDLLINGNATRLTIQQASLISDTLTLTSIDNFDLAVRGFEGAMGLGNVVVIISHLTGGDNVYHILTPSGTTFTVGPTVDLPVEGDFGAAAALI